MDSLSTTLKVTVADHRDRPKDGLELRLKESLAQCPTPGMLWTARRPKKRWYIGLADKHPLVLASSERFEQILWIPKDAVAVPEDWKRECRRLLHDYPLLYEGAKFADYESQARGHISQQEELIFPELLTFLPDVERALRELGYEHQGLKRGLDRMPEILRKYRSGELTSRERERFDLDYYHLLEHNLERKLDAVYPALLWLRE